MKKMIALAMLVGMAATAYAEPPPMKLNHQGRLLDAAMTPASGSHVMRFSIYSAPTGGTPLWTEPQSLTFDDGYYATTLGALTPIAREVFAGSTMYLAIAVDNDAEMTPREPIDSVPYAFVSTNAVGDITPRSISVNGNPIVDAAGRWVGSPTGLAGPAGPQGPAGSRGTDWRDRRDRRDGRDRCDGRDGRDRTARSSRVGWSGGTSGSARSGRLPFVRAALRVGGRWMQQRRDDHRGRLHLGRNHQVELPGAVHRERWNADELAVRRHRAAYRIRCLLQVN